MAGTERNITPLGSRRRDQILRAAEAEFERYGYEGARMQRIADLAEVPKANVHYYFANKAALYDAVLSNVVELWNAALAPIDADADPARVLEDYVRMKVELSRLYPAATRIFAQEMLSGWQHLPSHIESETRDWTEQLAAEIGRWIQQGRILPVDPYHLIFTIWATSQHYAQAGTQVRSIYRRRKLSRKEHERWADSLVSMVHRICGLDKARLARTG